MSESKRKCEKMGRNLNGKKKSVMKKAEFKGKKERNLRAKKDERDKKGEK